MKRIQVVTIILLVMLAGTVAFTGTGYMKVKEEMKVMEEEKQAELEEQRMKAEVRQMENEIDHIPDEYEVSGYDAWINANDIAEYLYEDSDGNFNENWGTFLALEAERKDIDPLLVYELLKVETGGTFDPETVGPETRYGHAYGLGQFMKNTGPWIADMADLPYEDERLFDPYYSIQLTITYLDFLHEEYGDWDHALTAYHRGMYGLEAYIEENGHAESWYAVEIQENAEKSDFVAVNK
ncbi:lytic transglycosylase domain-containing protein [Evansella halocellulosilytica]|uniref:lytic transglycosylase domain-containing protein n=1 Tax=Evansella halocellulosilytica TaxID=2011013 RepID=UPI000BB6F508|nr:transglycosylase SLT domain-containing protein [Evansella halocellulosilytica]